MKRAKIIFIFSVLFLSGNLLWNSCGKSSEDRDEQTETAKTGKLLDSSVVRDDLVDASSLDENGDGNVYQCPMHFQVISDEEGNCPLCKMKLEEYSTAEAQKNLDTKHKY